MSSRRGPTRRRANRDTHGDPAVVSADALLNPTCLEEQLSRRLARDRGVQDVTDSDESNGEAPDERATKKAVGVGAGGKSEGKGTQEPDATLQAKFIAEAQKKFEEGGDDAVQESLQKEIAFTKRLESESAQLKKRVEAAKRHYEAAQAEYAKQARQKEALHLTCKQIIAEKERLDRINVETAAGDEERREEARKKFDQDVNNILMKVEEQAKQKADTLAENEKLQREFDELKATFDAMMNDKMSEWKGHDETTKAIVTDLQKNMSAHERLQAICEAKELQTENLLRGTIAYKEQTDAYGSRMADFEAALEKSDQVIELTKAQKGQLEARITQLEDAKKADQDARKQLDDDAMKVRSRVRELRKRVSQLEKTKAQAEKKCRAVQRETK